MDSQLLDGQKPSTAPVTGTREGPTGLVKPNFVAHNGKRVVLAVLDTSLAHEQFE